MGNSAAEYIIYYNMMISPYFYFILFYFILLYFILFFFNINFISGIEHTSRKSFLTIINNISSGTPSHSLA